MEVEKHKLLNARIPRGPRASRQNDFKSTVWFFFQQSRYSWGESVALALEIVRKDEPAFVPRFA